MPPDGREVVESTSVRTSVSAHSSGTMVTSTQREYFKRDAMKCTRFRVPSRTQADGASTV